MFDPATTLAGPTLVTARSADALVTVAVAVPALSPMTGSAVLVVTVAVLLKEPVAVGLTCATSTKVAVEPAAKLAHVAVDVLPPESDALGPEACVKLTRVSAEGSMSVICAFAAVSGPRFLTVIV